jgi:hypothetical protein
MTPLHIQHQYVSLSDIRQPHSADKKLCIQFPTSDTSIKSRNTTFSFQ